MQIVVNWHLPDKVILMTCHEVVEINDLVKSLQRVADLVDNSSAARLYLIADTRQVKKVPSLIELLSIRIPKRDNFEEIAVVGLKNGMLRMAVNQAMQNVNQPYTFVGSIMEAEVYIAEKEAAYGLPLLDEEEDETVLSRRRAGKN